MGCGVWGDISEDAGAPPSCASEAAASAFIKSLKLSRSFSQMSNWSHRSPRGFRGFFLISWWPSIFVLERRLSNSKAGKQRCKICRIWYFNIKLLDLSSLTRAMVCWSKGAITHRSSKLGSNCAIKVISQMCDSPSKQPEDLSRYCSYLPESEEV